MSGETADFPIDAARGAIAECVPIRRAAASLNTTDDALLEFAQARWIFVIEHRGQTYLTKHQQDVACLCSGKPSSPVCPASETGPWIEFSQYFSSDVCAAAAI
jgi:hypothetical protein